MSTDIRDIFRRRRARQPMDERLPDGRSVADVISSAVPAVMYPPFDAKAENIPNARNPKIELPVQRPDSPTGRFELQQQRPTTDLGTFTDPETGKQGQPSTFTEGGTGDARTRRTQPRDYIADDEAYLRDLENKKDPFWKRAVIAAINAGQAGSGNQPTPIQTSRMRDMSQAQERLGREVKVAGERARIEQGQMVPVTLDNGEQVMVPARTAGTLRSRQQEIGMRDDRLEAQKKRWGNMDTRDRRKEVGAMYRAGGFNSPKGLEYAARELGIPVELMPKFMAGQMRDAIDENGNVVEVNRQTGLNPQTGQPVKSYETVKEAGKDRRAVQSQQGAMARTQVSQAGANQRAGMRGGTRATPKVDGATRRRAAELVRDIEKSRRDMETADKEGNAESKATAQRRGEDAATELNALGAGYEAGRGEGNYPYYKQQDAAPTSDLDQPIVGTPTRKGEDPKVRKYADQFFRGDYAAAQAAIKQQRGQ